MDEIESNKQEPKYCRLAVWSPLLIGCYILIFICFVFFCSLFGPREKPIMKFAVPFFGFLIVGSLFASVIVGILAIYKINKSQGKLKGIFTALLGIIAALFFIFIFFIPCPQRGIERMVCANRLKEMGVALNNYSSENGGKYPAPDRWCDFIKKNVEKYNLKDSFICPSSNAKKCSYAINPNCEPNSPKDVVLLFETKDGWNQFGGPELLTTENHEGKGCIILFNDGHVEFIKPKKIGKLKWKAE